MKKMNKALLDITCKLDVPPETLNNTLCGSFSGNRELYIENYSAILEMNTERMIFSGGNEKLLIYGTELSLKAMANGNAAVSGIISSVEWG